jgi:hypothetical protein
MKLELTYITIHHVITQTNLKSSNAKTDSGLN